MAFHHMMVLVSRFAVDNSTAGIGYCDFCDPPTLPSIPSPPPMSQKIQPGHHLSLKLIIIIAIISATFLLSSYAFILKFCANWIMLRRAAPQINITPDEDDDDDDDDNENQAPIHHIWYITTAGLEESVINSIKVCKYKRDEGLIEGTDCSVCLSEFHDGEDVRLLPKCSHAFHLPCIDTWLRSHVNCPMCRADVVSNASSSSAANPNPDPLDVVDETQTRDSEIDVTLERNHSWRTESEQREEEAELDADGPVVDIETGEEMSSVENCGFSVPGDLLDNQPSREHAIEMSENQIEPIRRSVSMDSLSASLMRITLNDHFLIDLEGSSLTTAATRSIRNEKSNPLELLRVKKTTPNRNQGILKMLSVCSKGAFLPRHVLMKRSFSAGCKFLVPRYGKGRNAILPL